MREFNAVEWNALVNRARATLKALDTCCAYGQASGDCGQCMLAASERDCRRRFRATERHLASLVRQVPESQRLQLLRTLDGLELTYRGLWQGADDDD